VDDRVAGGADRDAEGEPHDHREREPAGRDTRLTDRCGAGGDEQGREDSEPDQVAEGEVDDPGQAIDERVADRDEAVDPARGQARDDDLDGQAHGPMLTMRT
jgi:hypothetical protein